MEITAALKSRGPRAAALLFWLLLAGICGPALSAAQGDETVAAQAFLLGGTRAAEEARIPRNVPVEAERPDTIRFPGSLDPTLLPTPRETRLVFDVEGRLAVVEACWPAGTTRDARRFAAIDAWVTRILGPPRGRTGSRDTWWVPAKHSARLFERSRKTENGSAAREIVLRQERLGAWVAN